MGLVINQHVTIIIYILDGCYTLLAFNQFNLIYVWLEKEHLRLHSNVMDETIMLFLSQSYFRSEIGTLCVTEIQTSKFSNCTISDLQSSFGPT